MAVLQKIRSKGPLLIGVIALGLFAFIAGDAWRVIAPHQSQDVGEIYGKAVSAQDYQTMVEEYADAVKFSQGLSALTDDQNNMVKDQVWNDYVNKTLVAKEAAKLGLVVTDEEIQDIINQGTNPLLKNTPFLNPQTGAFDKDMLNMFLVNYANMSQSTSPEMVQYYQSVYKYWSFIEKTLRGNRLAEKYQALVTKSLLSNNVEAQLAYDARVNQADFQMVAIPYSAVSDTTVSITASELKAAYDKKKEQYRQEVETRDVRYIDVQVVASEADKAALQTEMDEYTEQLKGDIEDYAAFIRQTGSSTPYADLFYTGNGLPTDVVSNMENVAVGEVFGPYFNAADNTMNSFKKLAQAEMPDKIKYRQIQVARDTREKTQELADSIFTALNGGADFALLAEKYGQTGEETEITSANYEGSQLDSDTQKYVNAIVTTGKGGLVNLALPQANVILQVTDRQEMTTKYKVAVVKREVEFSKDTYNKAYNDFSEFVAANNTFEKMVQNAEEAGYRLYTQGELYSSAHTIGSIKNTKEALRWVFEAKPGEASGLYECGESDHLMMVGLARINKVGYRSLALVQEEIKSELLRDKKADKIMADIKAANPSSLEGYKALPGAVSDEIKRVNFASPAYVAATMGAETIISANVDGPENVLSKPLKGFSAVYVLQTTNKSKIEEELDLPAELTRQQETVANIANQQYAHDLYLKAKVKDVRYLFF